MRNYHSNTLKSFSSDPIRVAMCARAYFGQVISRYSHALAKTQ
jgi:hypothetical protein